MGPWAKLSCVWISIVPLSLPATAALPRIHPPRLACAPYQVLLAPELLKSSESPARWAEPASLSPFTEMETEARALTVIYLDCKWQDMLALGPRPHSVFSPSHCHPPPRLPSHTQPGRGTARCQALSTASEPQTQVLSWLCC